MKKAVNCNETLERVYTKKLKTLISYWKYLFQTESIPLYLRHKTSSYWPHSSLSTKGSVFCITGKTCGWARSYKYLFLSRTLMRWLQQGSALISERVGIFAATKWARYSELLWFDLNFWKFFFHEQKSTMMLKLYWLDRVLFDLLTILNETCRCIRS